MKKERWMSNSHRTMRNYMRSYRLKSSECHIFNVVYYTIKHHFSEEEAKYWFECETKKLLKNIKEKGIHQHIDISIPFYPWGNIFTIDDSYFIATPWNNSVIYEFNILKLLREHEYKKKDNPELTDPIFKKQNENTEFIYKYIRAFKFTNGIQIWKSGVNHFIYFNIRFYPWYHEKELPVAMMVLYKLYKLLDDFGVNNDIRKYSKNLLNNDATRIQQLLHRKQ